jgi:hypothetical protein
MSDYVKSTNFAIKDSLVTTDPAKVIKGTDIDNEYNAIANAIATKANTNSPALTGTPTTPTATLGTNTTQIASCAFVLSNSVPTGLIAMWYGTIATIPTGWYLCNGSNGTPDLRDKFVIGASSDETAIAKTNVTGALTQSGGSKDAIAVSHTHTATSSVSDPGHSHSISPGYMIGNNEGSTGRTDGGQAGVRYSTASASTGISVSTSISTVGSSGTNANLPPYFALAYIMKG